MSRRWSSSSVCSPNAALAFAIVGALATPFTSNASPIVATFEHGGSSASPNTAQVDAFTGKAGDGWNTAWELVTENASASAAVVGTGSSAQLQVDVSGGASSGRRAVLRRQYGDNASIDRTKAHTVEFTYTLLDATNATSASEYLLYAFSHNTAGTAPSANSSWSFWVPGDDRNLRVGNGDRNGGTTTVDTGFEIKEDVSYRFTIDIDPVALSWQLAVTDGVNEYESNVLGLRRNHPAVGSYLHFNAIMSGSTDVWSYRLDDVQITVPEPASLALLSAGLIACCRRRR